MKTSSRAEKFSLSLFALLLVLSLPDFFQEHREVDFWAQVWRLGGEFFPFDFSVMPELMEAFFETIKIATLSTFFAIFLSVGLAVAGSETTGVVFTRGLVRLVLAFIRSIPSLIWAVLAVALVGASARAGVIALSFYSVGYLGKFFVDTLDQADPKASEWLKQQGAHPWQVFQYGIWPQLKASLLGQSLWMWEYNIRSASIIGYVGAGGLGLQLHIYQEYGHWDRFSVVLLIIFVVVFLLQLLTDSIKTSSRVKRT